MVQQLGNNDLDLNIKVKRRLGQTKNDLSYASLHGGKAPKRKNVSGKEPLMLTEIPVDASPVSSSESEAEPESHVSGNLLPDTSDPKSPSLRKRGSQQSTGSRKKRRKLTEDKDSDGGDDNCMKSTFDNTVFWDSSQLSTSKSKQSRLAFNDIDHSFSTSSSQPLKTYRSRPKGFLNLHTQSSPKSQRNVTKATSAPSRQSNSFKTPSDNALKARMPSKPLLPKSLTDLFLVDRRKRDEKANAPSTFKIPPAPKLLSPEGKELRRSIRNQRDLGDLPRPNQLSKPPKVGNNFKIPPQNLLVPKFRPPRNVHELEEVVPSEAAEVVKKALVNLGVEVPADTINGPSSLLSVTSIIPDNASETSSITTAPSSTDLEADRQLLGLPDSSTVSSPTDVDKSSEYRTELCPACKVLVPKDLITTFQAQHSSAMPDGRIPWSLQKLFCRTHIASTARSKWEERGYPDVDWDYLPRRIEQHETMVEAILVGKKQSHYRKILEAKIKSGRKMTFVRSLVSSEEDGGCQTGYYGSRGARIM